MSLQDFSRNNIRENFLSFFVSKGHRRLSSSSLLPENDPSVLFTTAGMQQFKRFYLFPDEAPAVRVATCQKCIRTGDIDEVGDETHLTFFEMLGNFSFGYPKQQGSYFKKEAIRWAWEYLTEELAIDKSRIYATYFEGENGVPEDTDSLEILKTLDGLNEIKAQGFDDNFWSLGTEGSPGGPTVEFYVDGVEVWNLVFNEFVLKGDTYEPSELKGVDTGMGFERLVAILQNKSDVYQTDLFEPIIKKIEELSGKSYDEHLREFRIIADHLRAVVFMIEDGTKPTNKDQGYIVRRLIRRSIASSFFTLELKVSFKPIIEKIIECFSDYLKNSGLILSVFDEEEYKYAKTIKNGLQIIKDASNIDAKLLFDLEQSSGISFEISKEAFKHYRNFTVDEKMENEVIDLRQKHQEKSRTASAGMFKGGLSDNKTETTRLHTAAHMLLAALRHEFGEDIEQKGSNITEERLRFDFNYPEKLSDEQKQKIEDLVNLKIGEALPVMMQELSLEEAKTSGATGSFHDKYGDRVKIFTIGNPEEPFSREICGGPHVANTSELGHFHITKEESSSSGVRRIKAVLKCDKIGLC